MPNKPFEDCLTEMAAADRAILTKYWPAGGSMDVLEQLLEELRRRRAGETIAALPSPVPAPTPQPPAPDTVPPVTPSPVPAGPTPALQKTSVQIAALGTVAVWFAQAMGWLPPGVGDNQTDAGVALSAGGPAIVATLMTKLTDVLGRIQVTPKP